MPVEKDSTTGSGTTSSGTTSSGTNNGKSSAKAAQDEAMARLRAKRKAKEAAAAEAAAAALAASVETAHSNTAAADATEQEEIAKSLQPKTAEGVKLTQKAAMSSVEEIAEGDEGEEYLESRQPKTAEGVKLAQKAAMADEKKPEPAAPARKWEFFAEHTVAPGENLSKISEKYYGNQGYWKPLYDANQAVIGDNPNVIVPGQVLKIPKL